MGIGDLTDVGYLVLAKGILGRTKSIFNPLGIGSIKYSLCDRCQNIGTFVSLQSLSYLM